MQLGGRHAARQRKSEVVVNAGPTDLLKGQIYLEVARGPRLSSSNNRELTATGTHFAVTADPLAAGVVVTQSRSPSGTSVAAGQTVAGGSRQVLSVACARMDELMAAAHRWCRLPTCRRAAP